MHNQNSRRPLPLTVSLLLLLLLAVTAPGASASPEAPETRKLTVADLPRAWESDASSVEGTTPLGDADDIEWWHNLRLPALDSLIADGLAHNYNINEAVARMEMARMGIKQARAGYYPTVGISASWQRDRSAGAIDGRHDPSEMEGNWGLGVDAKWEIDLFGRVRASVKEKKAQYYVSRSELAAMRLSVAAEIATDYIQLIALWHQRLITHMHIQSQDSLLMKVEARYEAGLVPGYDVAQSKTVAYSTQASMPQYDSQIRSLVNALAVLTGRLPGDIEMLEVMSASMNVPYPDAIMPVLNPPAELLRRRPDIVEAEATLRADAAALGIAKKDFLPVLSLDASAGTYARNLDRMFSGNSWGWNVAPTLSWTIFEGFGRKAAVGEARAKLEADVNAYNLAIANAICEVDNAIIARQSALEEARLYKLTVDQARHYYQGIVSEYLSGLASYSDVAQAQISLLNYENTYVNCYSNALTSIINLYKAIGGGWDPVAAPYPAPASDQDL